MNIIDDLQKELIKPNCDIVSILRTSLIISHKLKLHEFEIWVRKELEGYNKDDTVPKYRNITGTIKYFNPFHGWCPLLFNSTKVESLFTHRSIKESIPKCISLINSTSGSLTMSFSPEALAELWKNNQHLQMETYLFIDKNAIVDIVERVKTELLNWAILLSDKGITGTDINFSIEEQNLAQNTPELKKYFINIYGNVENSQIQQSTQSSKQEI